MSEEERDRQVRLLQASCPQCGGPLSEVTESDQRSYQCLVKHRFTEIALFQAHAAAQERALWASVVVLEEAAVLARGAAGHRPDRAGSLLRQAEEKERQANFIRTVLDELADFGPEA
jgi:hypothetical protein